MNSSKFSFSLTVKSIHSRFLFHVGFHNNLHMHLRKIESPPTFFFFPNSSPTFCVLLCFIGQLWNFASAKGQMCESIIPSKIKTFSRTKKKKIKKKKLEREIMVLVEMIETQLGFKILI